MYLFSIGYAISVLLAFPIAMVAPQVVEGHAVNSATGANIPGVRVDIDPVDGSAGRDRYSATTDSEGRFRIESVKDGAYTLRYRANGFSPSPKPGGVPQTFSVLGGSEPMRLEVKLLPFGKLSGRVMDAAGNAVQDASIWLINGDKWCRPPSCFHVHYQSRTDEKGEYTIRNLEPGPWLVSATAPQSWKAPAGAAGEKLGWAQTFYPGVTDPQLAEPVMVGTTGEQWSPDIKLAAVPVYRLRGRVLDVRGNPAEGVSLTLDKGLGPGLTESTKGDGAFEFAAVSKGEWRLSARLGKGDAEFKAIQSVELREHDVEDVELRLTAPFTLKGNLVMQVPDGAPTPEPAVIDLELASEAALPSDSGKDTFSHIFVDGVQLTVEDLYPGSYQVEPLSDSPAPYYLDSIKLGDRDALGPVAILSDSLPLTITYKLGGGNVGGKIEGCVAGSVFLIPQEPALRRAGFVRMTKCGEDGRFQFLSVRPGGYYGFAISGEAGPFGAIVSNDELLKRARTVTARPNEFTSVDLRMISP